MKQMWFCKPWIGIVSLLCLGVIGLGIIVLSNDPMWRWRFRTQPPIPAGANFPKVFHPSNEVEQIIQFDIDPGAVNLVQQFYRTELLKGGWHYRCTEDKPLNTSFELSDVYERSTIQNPKGETLEIMVGKHLAGKRVIWVKEKVIPLYKACSAR
ncbi:MAG: hypothetical protein KME40_10750 [Komarekiella atlantica HA4396-MV6]|jgi:hypothetical protein|nr:hypothetical protein [Komarekiella atlantica HA4396-MV6]